ncbi:MAG: L-aspartate oxidase [Candidatus Hodarchaeales archaeon]|jgi:L-aspartate oxidase
MVNDLNCDVLIIGSGIAGLTCAYKLANKKLNVIVMTKKEKAETNTNYAQGGIASVFSSEDSFDNHINDTMKVGDGLCVREVVKFVVENGPDRIQELIDLGVKFSTQTENSSLYDLTTEGGHSKRRVLHAKDLTGREIERVLLQQCENKQNIKIYEDLFAIDLILQDNLFSKVIGMYTLDNNTGEGIRIFSKKIVLATGGIGKVFLVTSNPDIATGDGIALASRAGATISNMEFTQFHPTCLYDPKSNSTRFLLSEALRGEGGILIDDYGNRFMNKYDDRAELAPRDVVARAIDSELKSSGKDCVFLDLSHKPPEFIKKRFPGIYQTLLSFNLDLTKDKVPVIPAAHYICGGISTDLDGRTDLENLYCIGESAYTGLHGANRLASNSLLEAVVFAHQASEHICQSLTAKNQSILEEKEDYKKYAFKMPKKVISEDDDRVLIKHNWDEVRMTMWNYVGLVRSNKRLKRALKRILVIKEEINQYLKHYRPNSDILELRNIVIISELIIHSALERRESRGIHYCIDYPNKAEKLFISECTVINDEIHISKHFL